jgi:hypothetical protein
VKTCLKGFIEGVTAMAVLGLVASSPAHLAAQTASLPAPIAAAEPAPPQNAGIFPLSQVRAGMKGTAWTVFKGTAPEPIEVEILGVLRGARGPGQDMIVAQLHGTKAEYTGVVEGMSGSPVYIDGKLAGALSYRIGMFAKDPIAGITPIEQMLEVRDLPQADAAAPTGATATAGWQATAGGMNFQAMETPLAMSGFSPEAIHFWQQQTVGSAWEPVAAGGALAGAADTTATGKPPALEPGSAVSMLLVKGDLQISATCTVTYVDPKQLLACGHPVLGAGPVSMPMTTAEVVTTLASPLNAFKIVNTGAVAGAFTEDRESAIRGEFGAQARMIPLHVEIDAPTGKRKVNVEILDLPSMTPLAMQVVLYQSLLESNESSESLSYHLRGNIGLAGLPAFPVDLWAAAGDGLPAPMQAAIFTGQQFARLYSNGARQGSVRQIDLHIQALPRRVQVGLVHARLISSDLVHAGDTIQIEATLQPWQQPERNLRIEVKLPARLAAGNLRILVSDAATLDRTLQQPRLPAPPADMETLLAQARNQHPADHIFVSLLAPEAQGEIGGQTLASLPLSTANALEPLRNAQQAGLNGESAVVAAEAPAGGVLNGFQILNIHIEPGGGLN